MKIISFHFSGSMKMAASLWKKNWKKFMKAEPVRCVWNPGIIQITAEKPGGGIWIPLWDLPELMI